MFCIPIRARIFVLFAYCIALAVLNSASGQDRVAVHLKSGRTFTAWVDRRSDESTLWLRFQTSRTVVLRPIAWERIESADHRGETLTAEQLRELSRTIKSREEDVEASETGPEEITPLSEDSRVHEPGVTVAPMHSMSVDAELGNWDLDAEPDGIVLWLAPEDGHGHVTSVMGHVDVRLLAPLRRRFHEAPSSGGASLEKIGSWTRVLTADDIGTQGARLQLPFQAYDPQWNESVGSFGMVQIDFVVPGHGVFQRTIPLVRLRTFSPLRDWFGSVR